MPRSAGHGTASRRPIRSVPHFSCLTGFVALRHEQRCRVSASPVWERAARSGARRGVRAGERGSRGPEPAPAAHAMGGKSSKNDFSNQVRRRGAAGPSERGARPRPAPPRPRRACAPACLLAPPRCAERRPPAGVQIGTGNAGPPGSEELEIDVDMSTMDLRLKRSLPRVAAPPRHACTLPRSPAAHIT